MIDDKNFGEDLLHKIKEEKIEPKPRWQFLLKNYFIWGFGLIALFLGAISVSLIMYMSHFDEMGVYGRIGSPPIDALLMIVPFFWVICLGIFIVLVYFNIKHTKKGYRYSPLLIFLGVVVSSVFLGGVFNAVGFGENVDDMLGRHAPFYDRVINPNIRYWSNPENGRLTGLVVSQSSEDQYLLVDMEKDEWKVFTTNAKGDKRIDITIGRPARFIGKIQNENEFIATEILSMMPGKGFFKKFELRGPLNSAPQELRQINKVGDMKNFRKEQSDFFNLFIKYPELKDAFTDDLLGNKARVKEIINSDPEFLRQLQLIKIDQKVLDELQK